jgi:hypothetical protein
LKVSREGIFTAPKRIEIAGSRKMKPEKGSKLEEKECMQMGN